MTPPLSHPSPSVRALQAQFLHPASGSRPRRTSTLATTTKRRRGISSQSDESVHSADLTGEEDEEEEEEEEDSDFTGEEEASHPMPKRAKTGTRGKPLSSLDAHEKRLRRQQQNRDAAATSRNRKKQHLALLEQRSASLEAENHQLKQQLREQQKQITLMRLQLDALTHAHPQRTIVPTEQVRRYSAPSSPDSGHTYSAPSTPLEDSSVGSSPAIHPAQLNVTVAPLALDEDLVESDHFASLIHSPRLTQKTVSLPTLPLHSLPPVASRSTPITHRVESYPSPAPSSVVAPSPYSNVFAAEFTRGSTLVASAPTPRRQPSSLPLGSSVSSSSVFVGASTSASPIDPLPRSLESHDPAVLFSSELRSAGLDAAEPILGSADVGVVEDDSVVVVGLGSFGSVDAGADVSAMVDDSAFHDSFFGSLFPH